MHTSRTSIFAFFVAVLASLALSAAPASAFVTHEYLSQITEVPCLKANPSPPPACSEPPFPGPLGHVPSMSVVSGHLWLLEHVGAGAVDEFDASTRAFESQVALPPVTSAERLAVGEGVSGTELYVPARTEVAAFSSSGALQATWKGAGTPSGSFICQLGEVEPCSTFSEIDDVAVDDSKNPTDLAAGRAYVSIGSFTTGSVNLVDVFEPQPGGGEKYVGRLPGPEAEGAFPLSINRRVTVDPSSGDVLVAEEPYAGGALVIYVFEPAALGAYTLVRSFTAETPAGPLGALKGVAVSESEIYVATGQEGVVDQFSATGAYAGDLAGAGSPAGGFGEANSVAVDPATGEVYVGATQKEENATGEQEEHSVVDIFGPNVVIPDVTTAPASPVKVRGATLNGTVNPDAAGPATCRFEWGTTKSFGNVAPCEPEAVQAEPPEPPVAVHAVLSGLQPHTTYFYRLQASNGHGTNPGESFQDQEFTTPGPAIAEPPSSSSVTATSARLSAAIDPNGAATSYYFQYGRTAAYGTTVPALPGGSLAGTGAQSVSTFVEGLAPGVEYHYSVVASSEPGGELVTVESPDHTFTTQSSEGPGLIDGRAWEMVSPPDKHGARLEGFLAEGSPIQAAGDGGALAYIASSPIGSETEGTRAIKDQQLLATVDSQGDWSTTDISIPREAVAGGILGIQSEYRLFSSDLSAAAIEPSGPSPLSPEASEMTPYLRDSTGEYIPLVSGCPPVSEACPPNIKEHADVPPGTKFGLNDEADSLSTGTGVEFVAATPDVSHVVVRATQSLVEGFPGSREPPVPANGEDSLYEWDAATRTLAPISLVPPPGASSCGGTGPACVSAFTIAETGVSAKLGEQDSNMRNAISSTGQRVDFEVEPGQNPLFLRDMARGETVQIDAAQGVTEPKSQKPHFMLGNREGSRVFFTSDGRLTPDSTARENENAPRDDLYVFEVTSGPDEPLKGSLTDLSVEADPSQSASVGAVIGASEDGSVVYFRAGGAPLGGAPQGNDLYVERYEAATRKWDAPRFIAKLAGADGAGLDVTQLSRLDARVSPNGRFLTFMSQESLTGFDNRDASSGEPDEEVFEYDSQAGKLVCASCDPSGARPAGVFEPGNVPELLVDRGRTWKERWLAALVPGWTPETGAAALYQSRYLSDEGRLFFESPADLVPAASNGTWDVYEFEPEGVGGCSSTTSSASVVYERELDGSSVAGCVGLVSSGTSSEESAFLDASESGDDVFFLTEAKLASQDTDSAFDVYDARVCSSSAPCPPAGVTVPPACSSAQACGSSPPQPELLTPPATADMSGPGDARPPSTVSPSKPKGLTRSQRLKAALAACRKKDRRRAKREACVRHARKEFGQSKKAKK
jgi:hypothetical protein